MSTYREERMAKPERRVHPGTSKVFELIPIEQLKKLQQQFPLLRALRRKV